MCYGYLKIKFVINASYIYELIISWNKKLLKTLTFKNWYNEFLINEYFRL